MAIDLTTLTIAEARRALDSKEYSALDLTEAYLAAIKEKDAAIHAYLEVWEDTARAEAKAADERIAAGTVAPLTGIPIAVKDNILIKGRRVSAASKMLENYVASYDATAITKLKEQGVVFLGRTNMDEFAMGASTENSAFGPTHNPADTSRVPGGSSGGSVAAVAAHMALAALGSDTGGSVRQPSGFCGVVGMKPTYGRVSRYGLMAMGSSLDQIGPVTNTIADSATLYAAIAGQDAMDSTTIGAAQPSRPERKVIGVPRSYLREGVDPDVLASFEASLEQLKSKGYAIKDIDLPSFAYSLAVYYIIMPAEASTNLARFDGIRYGHSVPADAIGEVYARSRGQGFGPEVRRRILVGSFVLSAGYADAYYRRAKAVRQLIRGDLDRAFAEVDAIALPTSPTPAFKIGEKSDPIAMYAADIFTVTVNLAGVPAVSIPGRPVTRDGVELPVGFQLIAPHTDEASLFRIGALAELPR